MTSWSGIYLLVLSATSCIGCVAGGQRQLGMAAGSLHATLVYPLRRWCSMPPWYGIDLLVLNATLYIG